MLGCSLVVFPMPLELTRRCSAGSWKFFPLRHWFCSWGRTWRGTPQNIWPTCWQLPFPCRTIVLLFPQGKRETDEALCLQVRRLWWLWCRRARGSVGDVRLCPRLANHVKGSCLVLVIEWQLRWTNSVYVRYTPLNPRNSTSFVNVPTPPSVHHQSASVLAFHKYFHQRS